MIVKITLLAMCLALPAAVYAQDDCEEPECGSSAEAESSAQTDPDDEELAAADAEDAETAGSEEESEESADAPTETGGDDAAVDENLTEADADQTEFEQDEAALAADEEPGEAASEDEPEDATAVDPSFEPASPQSPTEPAPAAPASPPEDAAALQAFRDRVGNCILGQPIQGPPEDARARDPDIARGLYCDFSRASPLLQISQNQALYTVLGTTYGGDGRQTFGLPALPDGYCICMKGWYPTRGDPARGEVDTLRNVQGELCRLAKIRNSWAGCQ